ncbi:hypothetical protein JXB28_04325 [Candidatus Woesearchaeota archaeon]|nr:hypothetical protein [Candidatus Woesearchaeota archaeon]
MAVKFKQKCERCKTNYVTVSSWRQRRPIVCYECEKKDMQGEIKDPKLKEMLDIPEEFYKQNSFLRAIKINCLRYGSLTQPQIDAFKKTLEDLKKKGQKGQEE